MSNTAPLDDVKKVSLSHVFNISLYEFDFCTQAQSKKDFLRLNFFFPGENCAIKRSLDITSVGGHNNTGCVVTVR